MLTPERCREIIEQAQHSAMWLDHLRENMSNEELAEVDKIWDRMPGGSFWNAFHFVMIDSERQPERAELTVGIDRKGQ